MESFVFFFSLNFRVRVLERHWKWWERAPLLELHLFKFLVMARFL